MFILDIMVLYMEANNAVEKKSSTISYVSVIIMDLAKQQSFLYDACNPFGSAVLHYIY